MKIYLASPFFTDKEVAIYNEIKERLRSMGHDVFVPQEHEIENGWEISNDDWAYQVFTMDKKALEESEVVVCLNFGMYSDSGTAWEIGYAASQEKRVIMVLCGEENTVYSLMMIQSANIITDILSLNLEHSTVNIGKIIQK